VAWERDDIRVYGRRSGSRCGRKVGSVSSACYASGCEFVSQALY
jgi:hypothetical protein